MSHFASVKSHLWVRAHARAHARSRVLIYLGILVLLHPAAAIEKTTSDRAYVRAERPQPKRLDSVLFHDKALRQSRCSKENYANGSWVLTSSAKKNYLCCSTDGDHGQAGSHFCQDRKLATEGSRHLEGPVEERTNQHSWPYFKFAKVCGHACVCSRTPSNQHQMLDFEKYDWKPWACALEPFDAMTFCDRLKGRTLAVIGDSTGQQAGTSLMNMVIAGMPSDGIGCARQIKVVLSDTLINAKVSPPDRGINATLVWLNRKTDNLTANGADMTENEDARAIEITNLLVNVTAAVDHGLDFVVLGSGAHFHSRETYQKMLEKVADSIETRRKKPNPPQFLWKTISGAGCGKINEEGNTSSKDGKRYQWYDFKQYDSAARQKMREVSVPIVDMDMLYLRGDAHSFDCLHFCAPGPVDVFAQVLSHMLS